MKQLPYTWREGGIEAWKPTTLRALGKNEKFLEELLAKSPELLGFEPYRTGIRGPFQVFQQVTLETPQGREVFPDIVMLSQSGHVVIVEVKLGDNDELRDRRVIAQVVEYAASFAGLEEGDLNELFGGKKSWGERVAELFPGADDPNALAAEFLRKFSAGEVHLFIACDVAPEGLREMLAGVTSQHALGGYEVRVTELVPHTSSRPDGGVLLLPATPVRTDIIARTAVTISYEQGQPRPGVAVAVTSQEEILENLKGIEKQRTSRPPKEAFGAVIQAYESLAERLAARLGVASLKMCGNAPNFRQVRVPGWPGPMHYEMMDQKGGFSLDLHLESDGVVKMRPFLETLPARLRESLPGLGWNDTWSSGRGRLVLQCARDRKPEEIARQFERLIELTAPLIQQELRSLKML